MSNLVGAPGLEPGVARTPCAHVNQLHYAPEESYFLSKESRLMHLVQDKILWPAKGLYFFSLISEGTLSH